MPSELLGPKRAGRLLNGLAVSSFLLASLETFVGTGSFDVPWPFLSTFLRTLFCGLVCNLC